MKRVYAFVLALLTCGALVVVGKAICQMETIMPKGSPYYYSAFAWFSGISMAVDIVGLVILLGCLLWYALREEEK